MVKSTIWDGKEYGISYLVTNHCLARGGSLILHNTATADDVLNYMVVGSDCPRDVIAAGYRADRTI